MRRAILPVSLGLMGLGLTAWFMWWIFEGQREDVATARAFLTHVAEADYSEARALLTPAVAVQVPTSTLQQQFGQIEQWERLRFGNRSSESFNNARQTELWGTGITPSGCESELYIRLNGGLIDAYNVTPLCPITGQDA